MRLVVMNTQKRPPKRVGEGLCGFNADEQGTGQARALGSSNPGQGSRPDARLPQGGVRDGQEVAEMFAGSQFRHYSAVFGMEADLRRDNV